MYNLIIAGSRGHTLDHETITHCVNEFVQINVDWAHPFGGPPDIGAWMKENLQIWSGGARGMDQSGEIWSHEVLGRDAIVCEADWKRYAAKAGPLRNEHMARKADGALIFHHRNVTPGSANLGAWMDLLGKPKRAYLVNKGKLITP